MSMHGGEFGAGADAMVGFSPSVRRRRGIFATGVRRESREINRTERVVNPTALCGRSAEASGDDLPIVAVDARSEQMQHDASHRGLDPIFVFPGSIWDLHAIRRPRTLPGMTTRNSC